MGSRCTNRVRTIRNEDDNMKTVAFVLVLWMAPWNVVLARTPRVELAKKQRKSKKPSKPRKPANFT